MLPYYNLKVKHPQALTFRFGYGIIVSMLKNEAIRKHQWSYLTKYLRHNKISYVDYLQTDHWKEVRSRFWASKLHNHTCGICGVYVNLQVHHRSYQRI